MRRVKKDWIKSYRQMLDNPVLCKDTETFAVWNYLLLSAAYEKTEAIFNGKAVILKKGQLITSRSEIAKKFNISESKVQRVLKTFEIERQIEQQTTPNKRLITIKNWGKYQGSEQRNEQQVNNERTTTEQRLNNIPKEIKNSQLKTNIKKNLNSAGAYAGGIHNALIDEIVEALAKACDLDKPLTFNKRKYSAEDFRRIADNITVEQVVRVVNSLLSYKDGIENREYYILGVLAEREG